MRRLAMRRLPKVTPLLLKRRASAFDNPGYLYELKYDGFRALLEVDHAGARLVSRNRNRFRHLDSLAVALAKRLRVTNAVLDGELCSVDESGRPIFLDLLRRKDPCFVAFDLLWLNGEDLRPLPLVERKKRLKRLLARRSNLIAEAMSVDGRGKALMAAVEEHDLEGIVAKRKSDPYRRGVKWWKIKNRAYSQADDGRGELLNGDGRAVFGSRKPNRTALKRSPTARGVSGGAGTMQKRTAFGRPPPEWQAPITSP
jgi:bifunctional non-homologous end joining protein LigD